MEIVKKAYLFFTSRWVWTEAGAQMKLEESLGIGGFGYPVSR